ncbi:conserved Plasmodium protein, unknown function [Plasmodium reichenowi]|uniref:Uncharacterized protein n=1 Tax=Plasmodium reichenowi TaxID=5854 RepID=A0A2P9DLG5_PLARE|nr:conserved Plasmodium protein, unknown function [Plasmodium reichenowi]
MENSTRKRNNLSCNNPKDVHLKDNVLNKKAVLYFDEDIVFDECNILKEDENLDLTEEEGHEELDEKGNKKVRKRKESTQENKSGKKGKHINKVKKGENNDGKDPNEDDNKRNDKNVQRKKKKDISNNNNNDDDEEKENDDDNINIYKKGKTNIKNMDSFNSGLDSSTNSSVSARIYRSNTELKKKGSSQNIKGNKINIENFTKEEKILFKKWIDILPSTNLEIQNILNHQLPCYNILNNIKRINKIKSIAYNENNNDEFLNSIEKSNLMFSNIKVAKREKYIIRFLCEGSSYNLSELVNILYYVLNNKELILEKFPHKKLSEKKNKKNDLAVHKVHLENNNNNNDNNNNNNNNNNSRMMMMMKDTYVVQDEENIKKINILNKNNDNQFDLHNNNNDDDKNQYEEDSNAHVTEKNIEIDKNVNTDNFNLDNFSDEDYYSEGQDNQYNFHNVTPITKEDLYSCIPILLSRKNLGDNMKKMNISKNENNEKECLWVWENDNYDIFPSYYKEIFKYFKELRSNMSKIYKTLIKFKNSILSKDLPNIIKMSDFLNELKKKQYLESERRCKKILLEKKKIMKKKMDIKKQEEKKKKYDESKTVEEKKNNTLIKCDSNKIQNKVDDNKTKKQNLILSWLTFKKNQTVNTLNENEHMEQYMKYPIANVLNFNECMKDKLLEVQSQLPIFTCDRKDAVFSNETLQNNSEYDKQHFLDSYINTCENHKKVVVDYYKVYVDNKEFYEEIPSVDVIDGSKIVVQNEKNVRSKIWEDNEFYLKLKNADYIRSFYFYDNSWTRPFMSLLVHKVLDDNLNLLPFYYHDDMEYENDTNEDYYEKFETIDLTTENEENETESDGSSQDMFIVPDNEINRDIELSPITIPTSQDIYFFSIFNWEWNFEGNTKHNYNIIDKNVWKEFNFKYMENIYGCQYISWGVDNNPFKYMSDKNGLKNTLDNYDIKKLIKHSHGKMTKKDILLEQFKQKNEHLTKADTERKFKMYLVYKKCEDNRKKWMASEEGVKLFKNEELLSKIYDIRKRKLNAMSQRIEEAKKQKKMDKDNLKKEEKIKKKEKTIQEKLEKKESMKKDDNAKI